MVSGNYGGPQRRPVDVVREYIEVIGLKADEAKDGGGMDDDDPLHWHLQEKERQKDSYFNPVLLANVFIYWVFLWIWVLIIKTANFFLWW